MRIVSVSNARRVSEDDDEIMLDVVFEHLGAQAVPFCARFDDVEAHGRDLFARALAGEFGPVAPYVPPPPPPPTVPERVTRRQALLALAATGQLESALALFDALPRTDTRRIEFETSLAFERNSPTTLAMAQALGITPAQIDALFTAAAAL
jgi:hypothetical protein